MGGSAMQQKRGRLTREQEGELVQRIQRGDYIARDELVLAHLGFVAWLAWRYASYGLSRDELISAGSIGLLEAAERFKADRNARFASYAKWWILGAMLDELAECAAVIKIPPHELAKRRRIVKAVRDFVERQGRRPDAGEIARTLSMSEKTVREALALPRRPRSLDAPLTDDERDSDTLLDIVPDMNAAATDEAVETAAAATQLAESLTHFSESEQAVLALYYGILGHEPRALHEIASELGLQLSEVRDIRERALDKLASDHVHATTLEALAGPDEFESGSAAIQEEAREHRDRLRSLRDRHRQVISQAVADIYQRRHNQPFGQATKLAGE